MQISISRLVRRLVSGRDIEISTEYRYLAILMGLPLVDGVFLTIVMTGGLESLSDAFMVGSFILGGGAVVAMILSEFEDDRIASIKRIMVFSLLVGIVASIQALLAPTLAGFIETEILKYGAVLALISISLRILPTDKTDYVPQPIYIIAVFIILSVDISQAETVFNPNYNLIQPIYAIVATLVSATICILTVTLKPYIRDKANTKILKFGTSIGLIVVSLNIMGLLPSVATGAFFAGFLFIQIIV